MIMQKLTKVLKALHQKNKHLIEERLAKINRSPIIVLGNQKSGTSAIAHLVADYGGLTKTVDIPESWWPVLRDLLLGDMSLQKFANQHKAYFAKDVIKEPNLTFLYPQLNHLCPDASYVFVVRDPKANIRSLLNRLGLPGDMKTLELDKFNLPELLSNIFNGDVWGTTAHHYIDILSRRWNRAVDLYLDNQEKMILIRYEDFIADKVGCIGRLAQALEIVHKQDITDKVDIQYQPRGDRNVSWFDFFGKENLKRIERICGARMHKFGYLCSYHQINERIEHHGSL